MSLDESAVKLLDEALASLNRRVGAGQTIAMEDDFSGTGILKTCEGLEAFLTPIVDLYDYTDGKKLEQHMLTMPVLLAFVEEFLTELRKKGFAPAPYLDREMRSTLHKEYKPNSETDFVDTASFVVTTILDLKAYFRKSGKQFDKHEELESRLDSALMEGLKFLMESARERDNEVSWWSGRNPTNGHMYFTYTAVVALRHYYESEDAGEIDDPIKKRIGVLFPKVKKWLMAGFNKDSRRWVGLQGDKEDNDYNNHIIYTIYGILTLISLGLQPDNSVTAVLTSAISETITQYNKDRKFFRDYEARHKMPFPQIYYPDRSTLCVAVSALALTCKLNLVTKKDFDEAISNMYVDLKTIRMDDKTWFGSYFELYYTQRAIEAITDYAQNVTETPIEITEKSLIDALLKVLQDPALLRRLVFEIEHNAENASIFEDIEYNNQVDDMKNLKDDFGSPI